MPSTSWTPLLSGSAAESFEQAINAVVDAIDRYSYDERGLDWGPALLHAYLDVARVRSSHSDRAIAFADRVADTTSTKALRPGLYAGLSGVGWLAVHTDSLLDREDESAYEDIDDGLLAFARMALREGYDLISGAVGVGVYFLERLPNPKAFDGLSRLVAALQQGAQIDNDRATWHTPAAALPEWQRRLAPDGYYNLGVAHGVPGVIGLLAEMRRLGAASSESDRLMMQAARWVLDQRLPDGLFPSWIAPGTNPTRSRVAWCYGELGLSVTLFMAGRVMGDAVLANTALEIARLSAARQDIESTKDAGLCHGAAGNGHLFNRLFQATGYPEFRDASLFWFYRALDMRVDRGGIGGFRGWKPFDTDLSPRPDPWEDDPSFLTGACGIALAFLSATQPVEPRWDRVLLSRVDPVAGS